MNPQAIVAALKGLDHATAVGVMVQVLRSRPRLADDVLASSYSPAYAQPMPPSYTMAAGYNRDRSRSPMGYGDGAKGCKGGGKGYEGKGYEYKGGKGGSSTSVDEFRMNYAIDDGAARALLNLGPEDQFIACQLVTNKNPRNPSAVTWSVCKQVTENPTKAKFEYLTSVLDERATEALRRLQPEELEGLLSSVELARVRNVSAFMWTRIKGLSSVADAKDAPTENTSTYGGVAIGGVNLDAKCQAELAKLSDEEQQEVLSSVDENVRNPSAFVWSKIRSLKNKS